MTAKAGWKSYQRREGLRSGLGGRGSGRQVAAAACGHARTMDAALMDDLDRQIASVMDCNFLLEDEVVRLCEKVLAAPPAAALARALMHSQERLSRSRRSPRSSRFAALCCTRLRRGAPSR